MVKRVRNTKRQTLKDKFKIQRRTAEHRRKTRREARKNTRNGVVIAKKKGNLSLPNLLPYKEKFLRDLKSQKEQELKQQNHRQFKRRDQLLRERLENAESRSKAFDEKEKLKEANEDEFVVGKGPGKNKRTYLREVMKLVELADIVLLVLDARDPLSGKSQIIEEMVQKMANKKLVYILNKIDLVPKDVVDKWLSYLRQSFPTVAFRASTQKQKSNLSRAVTDSVSLGAASSGDTTMKDDTKNANLKICVGGDTLLQLLKNYSRSGDLKEAVTVGVVGYPNVGKSSLINSLKRCKSVGVSSTAGFTKSLQPIQLDSKVKLIDSPGVLFLDNEENDSSLVLRNCVNVAQVDDPIGSVRTLLEKIENGIEALMVLYRLQRFENADELVRLLAIKRGKLKKGGIPDVDAGARIILQDLNAGKIKYFVQPPNMD